MNGSSKIDSYLMPAKCTVSYHSVGFVVTGDDLKLTLLMQGVIYLFYNIKDFI